MRNLLAIFCLLAGVIMTISIVTVPEAGQVYITAALLIALALIVVWREKRKKE